MELQLDWQQPNNTEGTAWQRLRDLAGSAQAAYVPFPWASWIDAVQRQLLPPDPPLHITADGLRVTVCQHIRALEHHEVFAKAGITDLFWSHTTRGCSVFGDIRLHPFPLFPVRCHDHPSAEPPLLPAQRPLLYSFLGFHQPVLYERDTRLWLLALPPRPDALVRARREWHFEQQVYRQQVHGQRPHRRWLEVLDDEARSYVRSLRESCFALCPSGAGPNSIRLWEALGFGAIPVSLSDSLQLPGDDALWREAVVFVPEQERAVAALPEQLEELRCDPVRLERMQQAGQRLWRRYGLPGFTADVSDFLQDPDAVLLDRARRRLLECPGKPAWADAASRSDLLEQEDPTLLPVQVRRWLHSERRSPRLVVRLLDARPPSAQVLRWRTAVRLCRRMLEDQPTISWTLCSRVQALERLAAGEEALLP